MSSETVILEITDTHVKAVRSRLKGTKATVQACDVRDIHRFNDAELVELITEILPTSVRKKAQVIFAVPRRFTILRRMKLPSEDNAEIRKMVLLQIGSQMPYSPEDIVFDYQVVARTDGYTDVLVVAVNKAMLQHYDKVLKQAGIKTAVMTLSSLGLAAWVKHQATHLQSLNSADMVMLISLDDAHSEICFCRDGKLLHSRSIPYGERDLAGSQLDDMQKQISLSYEQYQKENFGPPVIKALALSSRGESTVLGRYFSEQFNLSTQFLSPSKNVAFDKRVNIGQLEKEFCGSLAVGLGMQYADRKKMVKLVPPASGGGIKKKPLGHWLILIILFAVFFGLVSGMFVWDVYRQQESLAFWREQTAALEPKLKELNHQAEFVKALEDRQQGRIYAAELLQELYKMTPGGISFRSVSLDENRNLVIQGYAETSANVNQFQETMVRSSFLKNVSLQFATKRRIFNMEVTDFKIVARLAKGEHGE